MKIRLFISIFTALTYSTVFSDTTYYYQVNPDNSIGRVQIIGVPELPGRIDDLKNRDANLKIESDNHQKRIDEIAKARQAIQGEMGALIVISTSIVTVSTAPISIDPEIVIPIEITP